MNTKQKRYSLPGNVAWMVKICWQVRRRALFLCLTMALCDILNNLAGLLYWAAGFGACGSA